MVCPCIMAEKPKPKQDMRNMTHFCICLLCVNNTMYSAILREKCRETQICTIVHKW